MNIDIENKVIIDIENRWKYCMVAFLVDRNDFLQDIHLARKGLKIQKLIPYKKLNIYWPKININNVFSTFQTFETEDQIDLFNTLSNFEESGIVEYLRNKYNKSKSFSHVIRFSILCGLVKEEHFALNAYCASTTEVTTYINMSLEYPEAVIVFYPESKWEEIHQAWKEYRKDQKIPDVVSGIKDHREWYWLKKNGWSYQKIRKHYLEISKNRISLRGVELAIKRYSDNLK